MLIKLLKQAWQRRAARGVQIDRLPGARNAGKRASIPADIIMQLAIVKQLQDSGRLDDAALALDHLSLIAPDDPSLLLQLGNLAMEVEDYPAAQALYRRVLAQVPQWPDALSNLALCLMLQDSPDLPTARLFLRRALDAQPAHVGAMNNLAIWHWYCGERAQATDSLSRLLQDQPQDTGLRLQLAQCLLAQARYPEGWRLFGARKLLPQYSATPSHAPLWEGSSLAGRCLHITAEQGLGDQIMYCSCLPDLHALTSSGSITVTCDQRLAPIFARSFPAFDFLSHPVNAPQLGASSPQAHWHMPMGDLPALFRRESGDFARSSGYLRPDPCALAAWQTALRNDTQARLHVGIVWRGGTRHSRQRTRSLSLSSLLSATQLEGVALYNLQHNPHAEEQALLQAPQSPVRLLEQVPVDLEQTAGLIAALDLVITVQTAVAHLAGALGKPCWVLLPQPCEWRYGTDDGVMPWYASMRLFRQSRPGDWQTALAQVRLRLSELASS